jgi:predicted ATPase/class 3 adenylate cyclase
MPRIPCTDFSHDVQTRALSPLPSGTVTFLFTDIEGSTTLWERDRAAMGPAVERHFALLCTSIEAHNGVRFKVVGDAVQAAFPTAPDGVAAALEAQRALVREEWPEGMGPLRVRMALHTAAATPQDGDYRAPGLNRLARLLAAAHGGQVLLSLATQDLARDALPSGVTLRDLGEHPLRDLYRPERVFQLLHPDLPADFPPIRTLATHPNNLPPQQTPFVGREEQIARVFDLLSRNDVRLVTITGAGGVGKTRLALQVAADLLDAFPDGAWFVDLSTLADASLVPSAIADALGGREEGSSITSRLAAMLAGKHLLLVLDNFERVVEAASVVASLLARVPGVKVLTTSRTPMHIYGEWEFPLQPFPMPDLARLPTVEALRQYEAVRLFVDRALAVRPDFAVTNSNAPAVAEICSRLDGLPLAIELAAAFIKVLPPQALLKRLEQRLPLLTRGARDLPARQQTMHNTIAWSHDLLPQEEQTLFRRLSVFLGGCTIAAAEAVGTRNGSRGVFGGLTSLVDKSLLRHEEGTEGEPRFRMLETVREYGQERLEASGEGEETRRRLAAWCLSLAEEAQPDVPGRTLPPYWVARLNEELPNLRAAVTWLLDHGEATRVLRLLAATEDYWTQQHTSNGELCQWLESALADAPYAPPTDRALAHWLLTLMNGVRGDGEAAGVHAQQALIAAQAAGEPHLLGVAQYAVGLAWDFRRDFARAAAAYAEAIPLLRAAGSDAFVWFAQAILADKLVMRGDLDEGVPMLDEAVMHLRETSADWFVVLAIDHRGHVALLQRDLPAAARWFTEAIELAQALKQTRALLSAVTGLAGVALALGEVDRAARLLGAVEAVRASLGLAQIHNVHHTERITAETRAAVEPTAFKRAWTAGHRLSLEEAVGEALAVANEVLSQGNGLTSRESAAG